MPPVRSSTFVQVSYFLASMRSTAQQGAGVRAWTAAMSDQLLVVTPCDFERVREDRQLVKRTNRVNALSQREDRRREPRGIDGYGPKRVTENVTE